LEVHTVSIFRVEESAKEDTSRSWASLPPVSAGFFLDLLFDLEAGGGICLRNIKLFPNYTVL
jgi:hypothetical protein